MWKSIVKHLLNAYFDPDTVPSALFVLIFTTISHVWQINNMSGWRVAQSHMVLVPGLKLGHALVAWAHSYINRQGEFINARVTQTIL